MARAKAICTCKKCGQEFTKIAYKYNSAQARDFERWAVENITICPDCWKAERDSKAVEGLNLAALTGSPKQISWAESIRIKLIGKAREAANNELSGDEKAMADAYLAYIVSSKADSRFWIDNRDNHLFQIPECMEYVRTHKEV